MRGRRMPRRAITEAQVREVLRAPQAVVPGNRARDAKSPKGQ
jgi:hypothetical protein